MADIREALQGVSEPDRTLGLLLDEFYQSMKALESDPRRGGKQATAIVMAINDINRALRSSLSTYFNSLRHNPDHHIGLGDIRPTTSQQDELCGGQLSNLDLSPSAFSIKADAEWKATEYDCAQMRLDDLLVPREDDGGNRYSIVGRINLLWKRATRAESDLETISLRHGIRFNNTNS